MEARIARAHPPAFHLLGVRTYYRAFISSSRQRHFVAAYFLHAAASFAPSGSRPCPHQSANLAQGIVVQKFVAGRREWASLVEGDISQNCRSIAHYVRSDDDARRIVNLRLGGATLGDER